ncbi:SDR family oxidoreductase [Persicobacter psychrovividus]|uniref:Epimerase n=1 Tax=Persicobacter psychrovividus TaxID=387638 RepID=A0ABM7VH36_9BACT|nr:epimerase [Persicobacter psychrovividus]
MKIFLTGANGYIGRRLLPVLIREGHFVYCLVRDKGRIELEEEWEGKVALIEGDLLKMGDDFKLPEDIELCYYLVHSMGQSYSDFKDLEQKAAEACVQILNPTQCRQIVYLSGIVNDDDLSKHLASRLAVEKVFLACRIPATVLRAAIIIGSGGASFEIIRDLVEKLPMMITPKWLKTKCQPIGVRNVIHYLAKVIDHEESYQQVYDIGGPEVLTYKEMLLKYAEVRNLTRHIITVPFVSPRLSSWWLYFVTTTSFALARSLVDSMKNEVVVQKKGIRELIPQDLLTYQEALELAFSKIEQNEVISSWKDAYSESNFHTDSKKYIKIPKNGCFRDVRKVAFGRSKEEVIDNIWSIGGDRGWYKWDSLWRLRGFLDKVAGGVGLRRGRRSPNQLIAGDALDFWRVLVADREAGRLLLYAEMKLPGEAWLEFKIEKNDDPDKPYVLVQNATFRPVGVSGRAYWWAVFPFHAFIFQGMAEGIVNRKNSAFYIPSTTESR